MQDNRKEHILFHLSTLLGLIFFIAAIYITTSVKMENKYQKAVDMIENKNWDAAQQYLFQASNYKDVEVLRRYVQAKIEIEYKGEKELTDDYYNTVYTYLQEIPNNYQGKFKRDIEKFKDEIEQKRQQLNTADEECYDNIESSVKIVSMGGRDVVVEKDAVAPIFNSDELLY
ncbi:MAG: hypothetical protein H0Z40_05465 [Desulfotomaculum sp.]|nr:hypothetical protein [Desulfotomaculum sp.]